MPSQQTDQLIQLVRSMTKAEKRSFRLYVNRDNNAHDKLFMQLFDYIDSGKKYNESDMLKKIPQIKKAQLSNIKANLLKQILSNIRHLHKQDYSDISIRELLDYARILQTKGMTQSSLDMLEKAKKIAENSQETLLLYHILDEERKIETQYITGSSTTKAIQLNDESVRLLKRVGLRDKLSNLSIMLYGMYLKYGYVRDKKDFEQLKDYFYAHLPEVKVHKLGFYEKIYYYQSLVWYYHMIQDFLNYYKFSQKWVDSFELTPHMKHEDPVLYFKGLHNALNALYMANKRDKFLLSYEKFVELENDQLTEAQHLNFKLFKYIHLLNKIFLTGNYDQGVKEIEEISSILLSGNHHWDVNREMVFQYKLACVYFGADDFSNAIDHLNKIINSPIGGLREDIQCFARILTLISHYELGNDFFLSYQIKTVFRFLNKMDDLQAVQREMLGFLRKTPLMTRKDLKSEFMKLRARLVKYQQDPYERRPFLYLDIISWLDSKIQNRRIQEIIREKLELKSRSQ
ncbi:MAG: hypothetical protein IPK35_19795 [Saprospiraceae bacterium]|jgi:hypothetical protein|nr:hypothetical protein [Saprospiraceae bacterium]